LCKSHEIVPLFSNPQQNAIQKYSDNDSDDADNDNENDDNDDDGNNMVLL
jgi:hypothetical protein